jgi:hypothetical protein
VLSDESAAGLWEIRPLSTKWIHVSVPMRVTRRRAGIIVHRRATLTSADLTVRHAIPVTSPVCTLIDIATQLQRDQLEAAVNEADKHGLVDPEELRSALDATARRPGVKVLRETLDRRTFTFTDSGSSGGSCRWLARRGFHRRRPVAT